MTTPATTRQAPDEPGEQGTRRSRLPDDMATTNHERVGKALELLKAGLGPFVDREIQRAVKAQRIDAATLGRFVDDPLIGDKPATDWDVAALLKLMSETWNDVFRTVLGRAERNFVSELRDHRNNWAHQKPFSGDDAYRALDTTNRLLTAVSAPQAAEWCAQLGDGHGEDADEHQRARGAVCVISMRTSAIFASTAAWPGSQPRRVLPAERAVGAGPRSVLGTHRLPRRVQRGGRAIERPSIGCVRPVPGGCL